MDLAIPPWTGCLAHETEKIAVEIA